MVEVIDEKMRRRVGWDIWPIKGPHLNPVLTVKAQEYVDGYSMAVSEDGEHWDVRETEEFVVENERKEGSEWKKGMGQAGVGTQAIEEESYNNFYGERGRECAGPASGEEDHWIEVRRKRQPARIRARSCCSLLLFVCLCLCCCLGFVMFRLV